MATIPTPEAGLVIAYAYLWRREQQAGATIVTVLPITHSAPARPGAAVEIPAPVKRHLELDDRRSWVVVDEGNEFLRLR